MRSPRRDARDDRGAGDALQMRRGLAMPDPAGSQAPREQSAIGYAMDALRVRPAGRRALSALALVLCLGGAGMFGYPGIWVSAAKGSTTTIRSYRPEEAW
jgi:hypothetical protein